MGTCAATPSEPAPNSPAACAIDRREFEQAHVASPCRAAGGRPATACAVALFVQALGGGHRRRGCSSSCARSRAWLIRSAPGARISPTPACSGIVAPPIADARLSPSARSRAPCSPTTVEDLDSASSSAPARQVEAGHADEPGKLLRAAPTTWRARSRCSDGSCRSTNCRAARRGDARAKCARRRARCSTDRARWPRSARKLALAA